jgi:hypothetical protein
LKKRKLLHNELYKVVNNLKYDLTHFESLKSDTKYHEWIRNTRSKLYPNKTAFDKNNIYYELESNPMYFLYSLCLIETKMEYYKNKQGTDEKQIRLFNIIPLRTNTVPKHITIDTITLATADVGDSKNRLVNSKLIE